MRCPSELKASPHISLWRRASVSSAPNELLPSNFSPSCRLASTHVWHVCNWLSEPLSCWSGRSRQQMSSSYSDVRRAAETPSLLWMIDSESLMARHDRLPSRLASNPPLRPCKSRLGSRGANVVFTGLKCALIMILITQITALLSSTEPLLPGSPFHLHRLGPTFRATHAGRRTRCDKSLPRRGAAAGRRRAPATRDLRRTSKRRPAIWITGSTSNWLLIFQSQNESYIAPRCLGSEFTVARLASRPIRSIIVFAPREGKRQK